VRTERGSVTPLAVVGISLFVLLSLLGSVVGGALVTLRRAQAAADLAALAGAVALQHGGDACAAAERSARLNHTRLSQCRLEGQVVAVRVIGVSPLLGRELMIHGDARAGPR
jgi:secretion/DNA translocation related TadE-like protein